VFIMSAEAEHKNPYRQENENIVKMDEYFC